MFQFTPRIQNHFEESKNLKEFIVVFVFILLLTGVVHTFRYSHPLRNLTVGTLYILGFFGLLFLQASTQQKNSRKQYATFTLGFTFVLVVFAILEVLLKLGF